MDRSIDDRLLGRHGQFDGTATFSPAAGGLDYFEVGVLRFPDQPPMHAERRYLWRGAGDRIDVLFDDGRPFHSFPLNGPPPSAVHHCPPDDYAVRYDFSRWPDWSSVWRVTGPRKNYVMTTAYRRMDAIG